MFSLITSVVHTCNFIQNFVIVLNEGFIHVIQRNSVLMSLSGLDFFVVVYYMCSSKLEWAGQ